MDSILISFIIPTYNWDKYLEICLDSILNQTYNNFELIVVDGWSTDWTISIIDDYMKKDKRIKLVHQKWKWLWNARNLWIDEAMWDYITFVDCDDFISNDFIEVFMDKIKQNYDFIIWWFVKYKSENKMRKIVIKDNGIWKYLDTWPWWRFVKRDFLMKEKIRFLDKSLREDAHFNINIYNHTKNIAIIAETKYFYRISSDNSMCKTLCKKFDPNYIDRLNLMMEIKPIDKENAVMKDYFILRACIIYLLYSGRYETSDRFINEYKKIFNQIKNNMPNYIKNKYIYNFTEYSILYQFSICFFLLIDKLWLVKLFASLYCISKNKFYSI